MEKDKTYGPILDCEEIVHKKNGTQYITVTVYEEEAGRNVYINACVGRRQFIELIDVCNLPAAKSKARARSRSRNGDEERTQRTKILRPKKTEAPGFMFKKVRGVNSIISQGVDARMDICSRESKQAREERRRQ